MSQETNALPNGYRLQEYCIETVLGTGGFGITYKARDTHLDTWIALKEYFPAEWSYRGRDGSTVHANSHGQVIIPEVQTSGYDWGLDRFLDEARVLARVQHPYVVRVKRYFRANGTAYIVMDYEEGEPLSALLKQQRTLSETQLHGLLGEVLPALEAVHQEGYLHRDIKPSNLYVRARDSCIMLIDFGAARQSLSQRSKSITGLVTPGYSPPEQYVTRSDRYGPWTDIYALGAVLYRCITGKPPVEAPDRQMWDTLVPTVETGAGLYHPGLLAVVDKALAMRPEDRFQSVADMREALAKAASFDITKSASRRVLQASARRSEAGLQESPTEPSLSSLSHTELALVDLAESPAAAPANKSPVGRAPSVPPGDARFSSRNRLAAGAASPAESAGLYRVAAGSSSKGAQAEAGAAIPAGSGKPRVPTAGRLERSKSGSLPAAADFDAGRPPGTIAAARDASAPELLLPSSRIRPDRRQDLLLLVLLIGLLIILGSVAFKIYQNYQSRVTALQQEQLAEETEAARQVALEKTRREQEDARRQEAARHLEQARQAMTVKDWSRAAAYLERADALQPGNPKVAATRAELMEAQRKTSSPVEIWEEPKVNMKLVRLKEGCFAMGSSDNLMERYSNETQHQVCLKSFWMGQNEVTNAQFRLFKPDHNSGSYKGFTLNDDQQPVTEVSWNEAVAYARWLSEQTGRHYRLPTEAEWEYAARAETNTPRYWGSDSAEACRYANVADKTAQRVWGAINIHNCDDGYAVAAPIGSFAPNAFQLYDILGNASEWTCSEYKNNYDNEATRCSMAGPQSGHRTVRGGSWDDAPKLVRAADRNGREPDTQDNDLGFRLLLEE